MKDPMAKRLEIQELISSSYSYADELEKAFYSDDISEDLISGIIQHDNFPCEKVVQNLSHILNSAGSSRNLRPVRELIDLLVKYSEKEEAVIAIAESFFKNRNGNDYELQPFDSKLVKKESLDVEHVYRYMIKAKENMKEQTDPYMWHKIGESIVAQSIIENPTVPRSFVSILFNDSVRKSFMGIAKLVEAFPLSVLVKNKSILIDMDPSYENENDVRGRKLLANVQEFRKMVFEQDKGYYNQNVSIFDSESLGNGLGVLPKVLVEADLEYTKKLLKNDDSFSNTLMLFNDKLHPEILEELAKSEDKLIRLLVANHINTPNHILEQLYNDSDIEIVEEAMVNRNFNPVYFENLVQSENVEVRRAIALSPNLSFENMVELMNDEDFVVRANLYWNDSVPNVIRNLYIEKME